MRPLPHITQLNDSLCGPAVCQLMLSTLNRSFTQDQIVAAARIEERIMEFGITPAEMALATNQLAPDLKMWFKQPSNWTDLDFLTHRYQWPVGIDWQGLFYDTEEEQEKNNPGADHGHYSVVTDIDLRAKTITLYDPYPEYSVKPRVFPLQWFEKRWWDTNEDIYTRKMIFLMTSKSAQWPKQLGMTISPPPWGM
jgi:hypothetical protein